MKLLSTFFFILIFFSYSQKYIKNYSYVFQYKILNLILHLSQIKLDPDFNKKNSLRIILNNLMKLLTLSIFMALLVLLVSLPLDPRPPLYIPPPCFPSFMSPPYQNLYDQPSPEITFLIRGTVKKQTVYSKTLT